MKAKALFSRPARGVLTIFWVIVISALAAGLCLFLNFQKPGGPPEKITFAHSSLPFAAISQVAQMQGYFVKEGLDAEPKVYDYGKVALQALIEGKADFAAVAETPVMFAIMNGKDITIIATIQTSSDNLAILARSDHGIINPPDLKGKTIATTFGTSAHYFMDLFLLTRGIATKDVQIRYLEPHELEDAFEKGTVDAVATWNPHLLRLQRTLGKKQTLFYDPDIYKQTFNVVATKNFVAEHPARVLKVIRALLKAEEFVEQKPLETQRIVASFSGTDIGLLAETWNHNKFVVSLEQTMVLALEDESHWAVSSGLARGKTPDFSDHIYIQGLETIQPESVRILR